LKGAVPESRFSKDGFNPADGGWWIVQIRPTLRPWQETLDTSTGDGHTPYGQEINSLAGGAYGILRERILRGELPIGKVISRRQLATELGMSLLPVSEAFLRLEFEGLLESRPRAGTRVRIPTEQDVRGHYVVREALEAEAARLFAEAATAQERAELQKLAARVDALSAQTDGDRFLYLSLHEKFHHRIAECTRCQPLVDAIEKNHVLASTWLCVARQAAPGQGCSSQKSVKRP